MKNSDQDQVYFTARPTVCKVSRIRGISTYYVHQLLDFLIISNNPLYHDWRAETKASRFRDRALKQYGMAPLLFTSTEVRLAPLLLLVRNTIMYNTIYLRQKLRETFRHWNNVAY